jgi:hypothetical protein
MAKTRHRNPRTAMRYVKPGGQAVAEVTDLLDTAPPRRWLAAPAPLPDLGGAGADRHDHNSWSHTC